MKNLYQAYNLSFSDFVGHENAKLSLILNAIEPLCGGVIIVGNKGCGKSILVRAFKEIIPENTPFVELPLNITEDSLIGGIDIEKTLKTGEKVFNKGVIGRADKGIIYLEDINLISEDILSILFETQSRGKNIVQREGIELIEQSRFIVIATMNPEEGELSYHFLDKFGLCVYMESIKDKALRKEIIKKAISLSYDSKRDDEVKERIEKAKKFKNRIAVSEDIKSYMEELLLKDGIISHRADIALFYASSSYAAYLGDTEVKKDHVDKIYPLVVVHRKKKTEKQMPEDAEQQKKDEEKTQKDHEERDKKSKMNESREKNRSMQTRARKDNIDDVSGDADIERIFPVGSPFKIKRLIFAKDRILRSASSGRRTKTSTKERSGRYVRYILKNNNDIAVDATIRAAAPYQKRRGRMDQLIIRDDDIRFKQREKRMGHLFLFLVDGSGSMAAQKRIVEAKAGIQSLLMDCYQRRDRVSMILFRKDRAEVVLPPTSSLEIASQMLKELPTGGATPLSAGLLEAYKLIRQSILRDNELRIVLFIITDGRANRAIKDGSPWEEVKNIAYGISSIPQVESIVVDTEPDGFLSIGLSKELSKLLCARYLRIEELKQEIALFSIT